MPENNNAGSFHIEMIAIKKELRSVIIGFWRMGASEDKISEVTGISEILINQIINQYKEVQKRSEEIISFIQTK